MSGLDYKTIDEVTLKLSGLIGVFDLIVNLLSGNRNPDPEKSTMLDFAYFISEELQGLYKTVNGVEYKG
jgi:hypothetical protein